MIKSGRYGTVKYDPAGTTPVALASLTKWKLSQKTEKIKVTCFGDTNHVYVPGMPDISGSISGFWNADNVILFEAANAPAPGLLALAPNSTEPTFLWSGLAYVDADIDCSVDGAPAVSGTFMAAGSWTTPGAARP
jgi:hypothetical protein